MDPTKKSELLPFLNAHGIGPKKAFSQNFLIDPNTVRKILSLAKIEKGDKVLEIGPGAGALTHSLLSLTDDVTAVELDTDFYHALKGLHLEGLRLVQGDILKQDLSVLFPNKTSFKVVSNLPYQITSPVMGYLAKNSDRVESATLMIQKEVAERFIAKPGEKDYSHLTLFLNFYFHIDYGFKVSKGCFYPPPKIDSAVVHLKPKQVPDVDEAFFFEVSRCAFNQKRKMLRASLTQIFSKEQIIQALEKASLKETARPQELSLEDFCALVNALSFFRGEKLDLDKDN